MKKKQNHPKTAAEVIAKMELEREVKRQRKIVTEQLYPTVLKNAKSITDATHFIQSILMSVRNQGNAKMLQMKISDLNLIPKIDMKVPKAEGYKTVLEIFNNETIGDTVKLIEGLGDEIDRLIRKELSERGIDTLKTDFILDESKDTK